MVEKDSREEIGQAAAETEAPSPAGQPAQPEPQADMLAGPPTSPPGEAPRQPAPAAQELSVASFDSYQEHQESVLREGKPESDDAPSPSVRPRPLPEPEKQPEEHAQDRNEAPVPELPVLPFGPKSEPAPRWETLVAGEPLVPRVGAATARIEPTLPWTIDLAPIPNLELSQGLPTEATGPMPQAPLVQDDPTRDPSPVLPHDAWIDALPSEPEALPTPTEPAAEVIREATAGETEMVLDRTSSARDAEPTSDDGRTPEAALVVAPITTRPPPDADHALHRVAPEPEPPAPSITGEHSLGQVSTLTIAERPAPAGPAEAIATDHPVEPVGLVSEHSPPIPPEPQTQPEPETQPARHACAEPNEPVPANATVSSDAAAAPLVERAKTFAWRAARYALYAVAGYIGLILLLIPIFRFVDPPGSALIALRFASGTSIDREWVPLERISPHLIRAVVVAEDSRFCEHLGIDFEAMEQAIEQGGRGASTISMQVTKNMFLWPSRSYVRKAIELPLTMVMELIWPKWRILEVYLNVAEWGEGVFGAEAAAQHHFKKSAARLSSREAALLAAALPNPIIRVAGAPGPRTDHKARIVQARSRAYGHVASCVTSLYPAAAAEPQNPWQTKVKRERQVTPRAPRDRQAPQKQVPRKQPSAEEPGFGPRFTFP